MKKQFYLKSLLSLLLLFVGMSAWADSWTRCTAVSDLTAGGTFIIGYEATANSGVIVPMQNTGTATTSAAGLLYSGTTSGSTGNGTIDMSSVTETSLYEVTIAASTTVDGAITIKCGDNYVGNTNTKNNLKLFASEATTTSFTPTVGTNDVFTLKIAANATYTTLQYNSSNPRFSVYTGSQKNVVIYKKSVTLTTTASAPSLTTAGSFLTSKDVTITNKESGATVYYTTDGNDPTTTSSSFTGDNKTITINATTTVKAMAVVSGKDNSSVTSATYTMLTPYTSFADALAAATSTAKEVAFTFSGQVVTAATTSNAYLQDASGNAAIIYGTHGFTQEQTLTGTVLCSIQTYNGALEFTNLTSSTEGITKGTGTPTATPMDLAAITASDYGKLVKIENLVYDGTNSVFKDGDNSITPYKTFMTLPTFTNGAKYTITGIFLTYKTTTFEIAPRTSDDIVLATAAEKTNPTITFGTYKETMAVGDADDEFDVTYNGDGTLDATSSNEDVAEAVIVGNHVMVEAKSAGKATITVSSTETTNYYAATKEYTLTITETYNRENCVAMVAEKDGLYYAAANTISGTNKYFMTKNVDVVNNKVINLDTPESYSWKLAVDGTKATVKNTAGSYLFISEGNSTSGLNDAKTELYYKDNVLYYDGSDDSRGFGFNFNSGTNPRMASYSISSNYPAAKPMTFADGYVRTGLNTDKVGTICLDRTIEAEDLAGAKFYSIAGKRIDGDGNPTSLVLEEETGGLIAGYPYIFIATSTEIVAAYNGAAVTTPENNNGLIGTFSDINVTEGMYMISDNKVTKCASGSTLKANRAYIDMSAVSEYSDAPAKGMVEFEIGDGTATGINALNADMQNGQVYNLAGQRVNNANKGVYIVNGKKYIVK